MTKWTLRERDLAPLELTNHRRPITRRDFLGRGLIAGSAAIALPSFVSLLGGPRAAFAAPGDSCGVGGGAGNIPFIGFDLAGGANMVGSNVLIGGPNGQLDFLSEAGYSKLGLPANRIPSIAGQMVDDLGLRFHSDSAFYLGIKSKLTPGREDFINGVVLAARSNNDTDTNPHNPIYGISAAGAGGALLEIVGTETSVSGGNSQPPMNMIDPTKLPTKVDRPRDSRGLVDTGKLVSLLGTEDAGLVMLASELISEVKLGKMSEDEATKELVRCGYIETTELVSDFGDPDALDPRLDTDIIGNGVDLPIFTVGDIDGTSNYAKTASIMKLVVKRQAGAGTIELGGYDYHDGTRATGEIRDFRAGECMGACIEYAARNNTALMLYCFTDGSVASNGRIDGSADGKDKGLWQGDNAETSAAFILVYNPAGKPAMGPGAVDNQIGSFLQSGSVDKSFNRIGDAVELLAEAVVLNYMSLNGQAGSFESLFPMQGLGTGSGLNEFIGMAEL